MIQNLPEASLFRHHTDLQIRFSDVDVLGHVNNTVYFAFYDTGKARYFESISGQIPDWQHVDKVVANVDCAFISQIVFGEEIEVLTRTVAIGRKSFTLQQMLRAKKSGEVKSICTTVMVSIHPDSHIPMEVPADTRRMISEYENNSFE